MAGRVIRGLGGAGLPGMNVPLSGPGGDPPGSVITYIPKRSRENPGLMRAPVTLFFSPVTLFRGITAAIRYNFTILRWRMMTVCGSVWRGDLPPDRAPACEQSCAKNHPAKRRTIRHFGLGDPAVVSGRIPCLAVRNPFLRCHPGSGRTQCSPDSGLMTEVRGSSLNRLL
jgi:hypothetical protein